MTETEYMQVKDMGAIESAENQLRRIRPMNHEFIKMAEYNAVMRQLEHWRLQYYKVIELGD